MSSIDKYLSAAAKVLVDDKFANFIEKSVSAQSGLVANFFNGSEKPGDQLPFIFANFLSGAIAAVPVYGSALSAVSLLIFKLVIDNPDPAEQQKKLIADMIGQAMQKDAMEEAMNVYKGMVAHIQDKADAEAVILKGDQPDWITMRMKIENVFSHFLFSSSIILKENYEVVNLPIYAQFSALHLTFIYDVIQRASYFGISDLLKIHYCNTFKKYKKLYLDNIFRIYNKGQEEVMKKFPEKPLAKYNYHSTFNKYQEYRNTIMLDVYQYMHIFAILNIDRLALFDNGFNYVNPRPIFSKMIAKTVPPLKTKVVKQGATPVKVVNPEAMVSFRMPLDTILKKLDEQKGSFYFQEIWRVWVTANEERINSLQCQYYKSPLSAAPFTDIIGETNGVLQDLLGPLTNQLIFNIRDEDDDDRMKFIGLYSDKRVGATKYLDKTPTFDKVTFKNHKISQVIGIDRTSFRTKPTETDPGIYGLVVAFVPESLEPNFLDPTKLNIMSPMCLDQPIEKNFALQKNYNNVLGIDALLLKTNGEVVFDYKCKKPTLFIIYIDVVAPVDATISFWKLGEKAVNYDIVKGGELRQVSNQTIQENTQKFHLKVIKGQIILKSIYLAPVKPPKAN
ncbi:hypothetical protein PPL_10669 [Heterostelium album PN500]|uniref:Pesticidal crystal protein domain-containing protein n=1 Tax=Heterostelium pallidum (strain ATCC 26659 / Pp 5 / PN500) TaxID=670386 RepID=D3BRQ8_HETP5|nr:hypothetical protein PPL_10669 [Heterostelium album PN500]EFA76090.1 hypothetical protein PPL_10669 [Heterostelium album PN500]|eukprot:XP_020428224.1 hypothetical protein PPL_10669 [Heterostelium album PN500]